MITRRVFQAGLLAPALAGAQPLRAGDDVTVLPTLAHRGPDGALQVRIEAWVYERNPTRTRLLARALGFDLDDLSNAARCC